jgi:hypothetical protein
MKTLSKRATVYFDPKLYKALQLKAVETESSMSEIVSSAIKQYLSEDAEDLSAFDTRSKEPGVSFEKVVKKLKREGKI